MKQKKRKVAFLIKKYIFGHFKNPILPLLWLVLFVCNYLLFSTPICADPFDYDTLVARCSNDVDFNIFFLGLYLFLLLYLVYKEFWAKNFMLDLIILILGIDIYLVAYVFRVGVWAW